MRRLQPRQNMRHLVLFMFVTIFDARSFAEGKGETSKHNSTITAGPVLMEGLGNFEPPEEPERTGPGEGGKPHYLRPEQERDANVSLSRYGMNMDCSDEISLDRSVPDLRHEECKHWNYPENLPKVSVIVIFHNEGFSVLMRTVHSVMNRTPPQFLEEVILVDDFSFRENLKGNLESYIKRWGGKVRLLRNEQREGLINTKSRGAREARGEIIVFLDAHCEVNKNWLPPLITPIYNNRTTMTVPIIDPINYNTFAITSIYGENMHTRGIFEWGLQYRENMLPAQEARMRRHHTEPYRSPTHAGGLFAINREYFLELGAYDPGLLVWGGENFELSFKVWQCGGRLLWVPCSRVGHVYKAHASYSSGELAFKRKGSLIRTNYKRVVETWMDERHKEYFYMREPLVRDMDMGDISEQLKLKERLQCKSFQWYMDNVAYDVYVWYPPLPPNKFTGYLSNVAEEMCVGPIGRAPTILKTMICGNGPDYYARLNTEGQLAVADYCIAYIKGELKVQHCMTGTNNGGPWKYDEPTQTIHHRDADMCLSIDKYKPRYLTLVPCDPNDTKQKWVWT